MTSNYSARLIDVEEAGHITGLKRSSIYEKIKAGEFRAVKLGRLTRLSEAEVCAWVQSKIDAAQRQEAA
jgi:excisionase family DNA binding protein